MANPFKAHPRVKNTDGRMPTVNRQGGAKDKEGITSAHISSDGSLGTNPKGPKLGKVEQKGVSVNVDEGQVEKMINRNASAFHKDIVDRCNRVKSNRGSRAKD